MLGEGFCHVCDEPQISGHGLRRQIAVAPKPPANWFGLRAHRRSAQHR